MDVPTLHAAYRMRKTQIRFRLAEFAALPDGALFYEVCFCILTPQSSGRRCGECVELLRGMDFQGRKYAAPAVARILRRKARFHKTKARYLLELKRRYPVIRDYLLAQRGQKGSGSAAREFLVAQVRGFGYKEASHLLRNIGFRDLAILDRHILNSMRELGIIRSLPKSVSRNIYLDLEQRLLRFARRARIPADELDLLLWSMKTGEIYK